MKNVNGKMVLIYYFYRWSFHARYFASLPLHEKINWRAMLKPGLTQIKFV